ncbi:hypothetical protein P7K49_017165 [Saguinus oedipus]|uniref:Uncharacterized protein n=1 Tax=Saguinus oedipus TaxID=9490 RepID=A0ABQ9V1P9_SAGOE|nr:hypothetical protein P7K49_017165 [Saguinus oedipus]
MEDSKNEVLVAAIKGPAVKMGEVACRDSAGALRELSSWKGRSEGEETSSKAEDIAQSFVKAQGNTKGHLSLRLEQEEERKKSPVEDSEGEPSPSVSSRESTAARQRLEKKQLDSPKAGEGILEQCAHQTFGQERAPDLKDSQNSGFSKPLGQMPWASTALSLPWSWVSILMWLQEAKQSFPTPLCRTLAPRPTLGTRKARLLTPSKESSGVQDEAFFSGPKFLVFLLSLLQQMELGADISGPACHSSWPLP